ncbi:Taurine import ATP-binding protein TauB [compost metagenome]
MLKIEGLTVKFKDKTIFENWNSTFEENKIYTVLGKSGCGKSTLLRTIAGLLKPNSGVISYNDKKITKPIEQVFMMHQAYTNFPWKNCLENVLFPIKLKRKVTSEDIIFAKEMINRVGLNDCESKYPDELSGGMKQRLALARVLVSKPPVILMDEPLSALDDKTRESMQKLILDLHEETSNTVIMVTHNQEEAHKMGDFILNL